MKTRTLNRRSEAGTVLMVTIVTAAVIAIVLLSFLELISARTKVRARSYSWNQAIPVLDSGIEEALTHLQDDTTNLTANGWLASSSGPTTVYRKGGTNTDGSFFITTISNVNSYPFLAPIIYSQGFVPAPLKQGYISRLVQVTLVTSAMFPKAIAARGKIDLSGQSIVDSYNSLDTNYSTGGMYDPTKRKAGGSVVTDYTGSPAINVGNGHIYGTADTGPGGSVAYNGSGGVGNTNWGSGIEAGYSNSDVNVSFPDPKPPSGWSSWTPLAKASGTGAIVGGTNYTYVVTGQVTANGGLSLGAGATMVIVGNASLYVNGDFSIGSGASIYIAPSASLKIYVAGNTSMGGGGVANGTGSPANFSYYGMTNDTTVTYTGQANFIGTIDAPEANFTISGGASVFGAAIVNTYTSKSSGSGLHYDEGLIVYGMLKLTSYREL